MIQPILLNHSTRIYSILDCSALTDGDALGVYGAQVAVLKQVHHEVLSGLMQQQQQQMVGDAVVCEQHKPYTSSCFPAIAYTHRLSVPCHMELLSCKAVCYPQVAKLPSQQCLKWQRSTMTCYKARLLPSKAAIELAYCAVLLLCSENSS